MGEVGSALLTAGALLLSPENAPELGPGGRWEDNALMVADVLGSFGGEHLATMPDPHHRNVFLQQVGKDGKSAASPTVMSRAHTLREASTRSEWNGSLLTYA